MPCAQCSAAFHHFKDPAKVTKLLAPFLRPGGALLVVDVSRDSSSMSTMKRLRVSWWIDGKGKEQ